jgi:hypothetical protein
MLFCPEMHQRSIRGEGDMKERRRRGEGAYFRI